MAIAIRRLEEHDEVENFDCGDEPLNNYLKRYAWTNQEKSSIGVSYVAVDEGAPRVVLGYFTLAMDGDGQRAARHVSKEIRPQSATLRLTADFIGTSRCGSAIFRAGGLGQALISEALRVRFARRR